MTVSRRSQMVEHLFHIRNRMERVETLLESSVGHMKGIVEDCLRDPAGVHASVFTDMIDMLVRLGATDGYIKELERSTNSVDGRYFLPTEEVE